MADIDIGLKPVLEPVVGLEKLRDSIADAISDGIKKGTDRAVVKQATGLVNQLASVPLTLENRNEVLQARLGARPFANEIYSFVKANGSAETIAAAGFLREQVNQLINEARRFPADVDRERKRIENEAKANKKQKERDDRLAEIKKARDLREQAKEERLRDAEQVEAETRAKYNAYSSIFLRVTEDPETADIERAQALLKDIRTAGRRSIPDLRATGASRSEVRQRENAIAENEEELNKRLKAAVDAQNENTKVLTKTTDYYKQYRGLVAAGATGVYVGNYASNMLQGYYGNRVNPYTEMGGKIDDLVQKGGGVIGSVLGGIIGSFIAPGVGTIIGASIGGAGGAYAGGWWNRVRSASISSQEDAIDHLRWALKYGQGGAGYFYARLAEKTGFMSTDDVEAIAMSSATFMPSVALGKISPDQWFALAQMPNVYSALSNRADPATLMKAFQADIGMYSEGWGAVITQMLGWPDSARLLAGSGMLENLERDIDIMDRMSMELGLLGYGAIPKYYDRGREDILSRRDSWYKTVEASNRNKNYYLSQGPRALPPDTTARLLGYTEEQRKIDTLAPSNPFGKYVSDTPLYYLYNYSERDAALMESLKEDILKDREPSRLTPVNLNVYVNDEKIRQYNGLYADTNELTDKVEYKAGN